MKEENKALKQWISFRVKPEEYAQIYRHFQASACRKLSVYARKVLMQKPVIIQVRNQTAQDFLTEMVGLKNELNALGNNFNQVVKKLHLLNHYSELKMWALVNEAHQKKLAEKVEEIRIKLNQIYELWLQK